MMVGEEAVARAWIRELHRDCCEGSSIDDICALPLTDGEKQAARAAMSAHLAALERAGWVVVPREPTEAMIDAGDDICPIARGTESHKMGGGVVPEDYWRAMIAAAPPPQNSDEVK